MEKGSGAEQGEEEEKGKRKQSTESGLKFTVFGGEQQFSTGHLGAVGAQGSFLPSGAGASSCSNKSWRKGREGAMSRGVGQAEPRPSSCDEAATRQIAAGG